MPPITFAHRGGAASAPENTVEAFLGAKAHGARGIESDVRLSGDGQPVLVHEASLGRGFRRRKVESTTADDLGGLGVPRLSELYEAVGTDLHVSLDVKDTAAAHPTLELVRSLDDRAVERLWLCSPELTFLEELRATEPRVRLVHSTTRGALDSTIERHAARLAEAGIDAFNLHRTEWSKGLVVLFQRFDVLAFAWDVQEVRHVEQVVSYGIDALYSDHVERMVAAVNSSGVAVQRQSGSARPGSERPDAVGAKSGRYPAERPGFPGRSRDEHAAGPE